MWNPFRVINRDTRTSSINIPLVSFILTFSISNTGLSWFSCGLCTSVYLLPCFCLYSFVLVSLLLSLNRFHAWIYFSCYQPWTWLLAKMSWSKQTIKRLQQLRKVLVKGGTDILLMVYRCSATEIFWMSYFSYSLFEIIGSFLLLSFSWFFLRVLLLNDKLFS